MICGSLLLDEGIIIRKAVAHPIKKVALEFLVMMEYEDEQENLPVPPKPIAVCFSLACDGFQVQAFKLPSEVVKIFPSRAKT